MLLNITGNIIEKLKIFDKASHETPKQDSNAKAQGFAGAASREDSAGNPLVEQQRKEYLVIDPRGQLGQNRPEPACI